MEKNETANEVNVKKQIVGGIEPQVNELPQDYKDVSNQDLFKNHVLCA